MKDEYFIHPKAYWRVIDFVETFCTYTEGELAKQPIKLPTWIKWELRTIYGRYSKKTHRRAVREAYLEVGKKNGKSMLCSALSLYHLLADGYYTKSGKFIAEKGPSVFAAAATRDQARLVFDSASRMVKNDEDLLDRVRPMQYDLKLREPRSGMFKVLSSDAEGHEGIKSSFTIVDELHIHKDDGKLYSTLKGAGVSRAQPLIIIISTAGLFDPTTIGWRKHEYALRVQNDWKLDPGFHGKVFAAPQDLTDEQCLDEKYWKAANPNLGRSVKIEVLRDIARQAKNDPAELNQFKRYHLNIWVRSHSEWIPMSLVKACNRGGNVEENLGERCWMGIDIGATEDLTAVARLFHKGQEKRMVEVDGEKEERMVDLMSVQVDHFCTANKIDPVQNNSQHITYMQWVKDGHIRIMGDTDTDYIGIRKTIEDYIDNKYKVRNITFDKMGTWEMAVALDKKYLFKGKQFLRPIDFNSYTTSAPMKKLQYMLRNQLIELYDDPLMDWQIGNVMVKIDSKDRIFLNKKESKNKVDAVAAVILAVDGYMNDTYKDKKAPQILIV